MGPRVVSKLFIVAPLRSSKTEEISPGRVDSVPHAHAPQARYLVERQSPELWEIVLNPENEFRRQVIDQAGAAAASGCSLQPDLRPEVPDLGGFDSSTTLVFKAWNHHTIGFSRNC